MLLFLQIFISVVWLSSASGTAGDVLHLHLDTPITLDLIKDHRQTACVAGVGALFLETVITVKFTAGAGADKDLVVPLFAVRGRSTDDLHDNVSRWIGKILLKTKITNPEEDVVKKLEGRGFLLRDLLSSCRSPLFSHSQFGTEGICRMTFSSMGTACVSLPAMSSQNQVTLLATRGTFPIHHVRNLALCFGLLAVANQLSKSKIVQYSIGTTIFLLAGLLLLVLNFDRVWGRQSAAPRSVFFIFMATTTYAYAVTMMYDILVNAFINYWELFLAYTSITGCLGLVFVRMIRSNENTKHSFRVASKWAIRLAAMTLGYNAFPSPFVASSFLASLFSVWLLRWLSINVGRSKL